MGNETVVVLILDVDDEFIAEAGHSHPSDHSERNEPLDLIGEDG